MECELEEERRRRERVCGTGEYINENR